jgi:hypothetical protein
MCVVPSKLRGYRACAVVPPSLPSLGALARRDVYEGELRDSAAALAPEEVGSLSRLLGAEPA